MRRAGLIERRDVVVPRVKPYGSTFVNPSSIPGLVAWFDMQDAASYTQAGTVTSITNKASSTAWTEGTVPPDYDATGMNGFPCMSFTGTQRIISTEAAVVAAMQGGTSFTLFIVGKMDTADAATAFFGAGLSSHATSATRYFGNNITGAGVWICASRNNTGVTVNAESAGGGADTNINVLEFYTDAAVTSIQENGATADPDGAAQATGASGPDRCSIGSRPASTPNVLLVGDVGEIVLYSALLNATDRGSVRSYLGAKWGVTVA